MTAVHEGDLVLGALGTMGSPVDCSGLGRLDLEGPQVLWLVAGPPSTGTRGRVSSRSARSCRTGR
ncbi:hypothetical protein ACWDAZ_42355, partial [Streptomyces sp. NPDC001215]